MYRERQRRKVSKRELTSNLQILTNANNARNRNKKIEIESENEKEKEKESSSQAAEENSDVSEFGSAAWQKNFIAFFNRCVEGSGERTLLWYLRHHSIGCPHLRTYGTIPLVAHTCVPAARFEPSAISVPNSISEPKFLSPLRSESVPEGRALVIPGHFFPIRQLPLVKILVPKIGENLESGCKCCNFAVAFGRRVPGHGRAGRPFTRINNPNIMETQCQYDTDGFWDNRKEFDEQRHLDRGEQ